MVMNKGVEYGGDSIVDFTDGIVYPSTTQNGTFNSVDLQRGLVDWHTHPATCRKVNECTMGLPSPADLVNVLQGAALGTLCHLLYSREGTYVIQVTAPVRRALVAAGGTSQSQSRTIMTEFTALFKKFNSKQTMSAVQYESLCHAYIARARREGVYMKLFKGDTIPRFDMKYNCEFKTAGPGLSAVRK